MNTSTQTKQSLEIAPGVVKGRWHHRLADGRVQCDLCPRDCRLKDGQRGFCYLRENRHGEVVLTSYGRITGYGLDPVEKKPLNHYHPGSMVLSFGTAGCNLGCQFCQNWDTTKAVQNRIKSMKTNPRQVAQMAKNMGCQSIAFTYNEPTIFAEFAIDCARECHDRGLNTIAVSNGYISPTAREQLYAHIDAVNVDLKAIDGDFYGKICLSKLQPVLDTLNWIRHQSSTWLEVTNLLIPGHNDSERQVDELCTWFYEELGPDVPLHLSAFHPDYKMLDVPRTPPETLHRARKQAKDIGLKHVYTGNIRDQAGQSSYCAGCDTVVIKREGYHISDWKLDEQARCRSCGERFPGCFDHNAAKVRHNSLPL